MASKLDMISRLAAAVPVVNQQAADQLQANRTMQVQKAVAATPAAAAPATRVAQQIAPASIAQAGQINTQLQTQNLQQTTALAQQGLASTEAAQRTDQQQQATGQAAELTAADRRRTLELSRAESASTKKLTQDEISSTKRAAAVGMEQDNTILDLSLRQRTELANVGGDVKAKLFNSRLLFEKDEQGRKFSNERQLSDYAVSSAKSEVALQTRLQDLKQASDQKIAVLQHSSKQLLEGINRGWLVKEQKLDYEQKRYLLDLHQKLEEKIKKQQARAANNLAMTQGIFIVIGAVVGGVVGGGTTWGAGTAVGASAGASAGAGVGTAVYGATS